MNGFDIIPGILTTSVSELQDKVNVSKRLAKRVHIDVIDGLFVDNNTVMPKDFSSIDWGDLMIDVQLMTKDPGHYLGDLGGVSRVFGHVEMMKDKLSFLKMCEEKGVGAGWGINIETNFEDIGLEVLNRVNAIILMAIKVGFSGQKFREEALERIEQLRDMGFRGDIVMDGGMNLETIPSAIKAGVNQFAVNSGLWQTEDVESRYKELVRLLPNDENDTA